MITKHLEFRFLILKMFKIQKFSKSQAQPKHHSRHTRKANKIRYRHWPRDAACRWEWWRRRSTGAWTRCQSQRGRTTSAVKAACRTARTPRTGCTTWAAAASGNSSRPLWNLRFKSQLHLRDGQFESGFTIREDLFHEDLFEFSIESEKISLAGNRSVYLYYVLDQLRARIALSDEAN